MSTQLFQCPRCGATNTVGNRFCFNCGSFLEQDASTPTTESKKANSILITIGLLFGLFSLCALCGVIGNLIKNDKSKSEVVSKVNGSDNNDNTKPVAVASAVETPKPSFAELKKRSEELLKLQKEEYSKEDLKEFSAVMKWLREIPKEAKEYRQAQALNKKLFERALRIGKEILVLGPKPINSPWDGRVNEVVRFLQNNLNDYDSCEFIEWSPVTKVEIKGQPFWAVRLKLRAKNAFGAYIVKDTYYLIRNNEVVAAEGL